MVRGGVSRKDEQNGGKNVICSAARTSQRPTAPPG